MVNIDIGKTIRISDFIDATDKRSLIVDTTIASAIGASKGLENLSGFIESICYFCDGIMVNPGSAEHQAGLLAGKYRAAPIIRMDWTNAYRDQAFCLPANVVKRVNISNPIDALTLGASAVVASFLLGFDDEFEANNIKDLSFLARGCHQISLPLMVDIRAIGEKVVAANFEESIKLGVSFIQELGADIIIIPECSLENVDYICSWLSVPVLLHVEQFPEEEKVKGFFAHGLAGLVVSAKLCRDRSARDRIKTLQAQIHGQGRKS